MLANYGYTDGSGDWYITIDTDKCDACAACAEACPEHMFEVEADDWDELKAVVKRAVRKNIKYLCGPCKPVSGERHLPCVESCAPGAIIHSW